MRPCTTPHAYSGGADPHAKSLFVNALDTRRPFRYGLVDLCEREWVPFARGHALAMTVIHGGKTKNDRLDARKIAGLLKGGRFPTAHVHPRAKRETRDLRRRRPFFVRPHAH